MPNIFDRQFWRATVERMIRGAVAAVFAAYVAGDLVFDVTNIHTLNQVLVLLLGGAFSALALSLGGGAYSKNGPAFTRAEVVPATPPATHVRPQRGEGGLLYILAVVLVILVLLWVVFVLLGGR